MLACQTEDSRWLVVGHMRYDRALATGGPRHRHRHCMHCPMYVTEKCTNRSAPVTDTVRARQKGANATGHCAEMDVPLAMTQSIATYLMQEMIEDSPKGAEGGQKHLDTKSGFDSRLQQCNAMFNCARRRCLA